MRRATLLLLVALAGTAQAQPQPDKDIEQIIVTAQRNHAGVTPNAIAHDFIRSVAAPSLLINEIARWHMGICPRTDGLSTRNLNAYVTGRIRDVAAQAGAPVAPEPCKSNLEILFTDQPQEALAAVRDKSPAILGYHPATLVSHAMQAWYMTGTTDIDGRTVVDHDVSGSIAYTNGSAYDVDSNTGKPTDAAMVGVSGIPETRIEGWKGRPEVTSDIMGALIIADRRRTGSLALGPIADYIAMLALSRTDDYEDCQLTASITNLLSAKCDAAQKPSQISASDIAYLRGVYKMMDPGASLQIQQDQIASEMAKALAGK